MKLSEHLQAVNRLFLDTAPVIYYVEGNERYLPLVDPIFNRLDAGQLTVITSPITLAECLVVPYRGNNTVLLQAFSDLLTRGSGAEFTSLGQEQACQAAELRARYNLSLTDAFQLAIALTANCDAFLTNDAALKRITGMNVIILDEHLSGEDA